MLHLLHFNRIYIISIFPHYNDGLLPKQCAAKGILIIKLELNPTT